MTWVAVGEKDVMLGDEKTTVYQRKVWFYEQWFKIY